MKHFLEVIIQIQILVQHNVMVKARWKELEDIVVYAKVLKRFSFSLIDFQI